MAGFEVPGDIEQRRVMWPAAGRREVLSRGVAEGAEEILGQYDRMSMIGGPGSGPWEVLTAEMKRYEYQIGPTGQISYAAPSGYHDDCVMALALGEWGCHTFGVEPGMMMRLGGGMGRGQRSEIGGRSALTLA